MTSARYLRHKLRQRFEKFGKFRKCLYRVPENLERGYTACWIRDGSLGPISPAWCSLKVLGALIVNDFRLRFRHSCGRYRFWSLVIR
jgi:hypothetical protein